jgi:hypothetical protein
MRIDLVFLLFLDSDNHLDNTVFEVFVKVIHLLIPKHFDWMEVFLQNKLILLLFDLCFPLELATTSNALLAAILFVRGAETIAFPNTDIIILIIVIDLKVLFIKLFIFVEHISSLILVVHLFNLVHKLVSSCEVFPDFLEIYEPHCNKRQNLKCCYSNQGLSH